MNLLAEALSSGEKAGGAGLLIALTVASMAFQFWLHRRNKR